MRSLILIGLILAGCGDEEKESVTKAVAAAQAQQENNAGETAEELSEENAAAVLSTCDGEKVDVPTTDCYLK